MKPQSSTLEGSWLLASLIVVLLGVVGGMVFLQISAQAQESETLVFEAEDALLTGRFIVRLDESASGGRLADTPVKLGKATSFDDRDGAQVCIHVPRDGIYRVAARVRGKTRASNSFYVKLNQHEPWAWWFKKSTDFKYAQVNDANGDPLEMFLGEGDHTLAFYRREAATQLDTILIFPKGDAAPAQPCEDATTDGVLETITTSSIVSAVPEAGVPGLANALEEGLPTTTSLADRAEDSKRAAEADTSETIDGSAKTIDGSDEGATSTTSGGTGTTVVEEGATTTTQGSNTPTTSNNQTTSTTTQATTTTTKATTTTTTPPLPPTGSSYPGRPGSGKFYWGASLTGNGDPDRHEDPTGEVLSIRRTFFSWSQRTGYMISVAKGDVSAGRLPWVSIKPPSWKDMAAGKHDSEIDAMLKALDAINGPVWLTVHHEPENDSGSPSDHLAMNKRVRQRMNALDTDNIALAPILMSWTFNPKSGRDPDAYWASNVYDFVGVDHYNRDTPPENLETMDSWKLTRSWAKGKGKEIAVGEWGMKGSNDAAANRIRDWFDHAAGTGSDGKGARVVGLAVYDNDGGSYGPWTLEGQALKEFQKLMSSSKVAHIR